jgi:hypothetical protein
MEKGVPRIVGPFSSYRREININDRSLISFGSCPYGAQKSPYSGVMGRVGAQQPQPIDKSQG